MGISQESCLWSILGGNPFFFFFFLLIGQYILWSPVGLGPGTSHNPTQALTSSISILFFSLLIKENLRLQGETKMGSVYKLTRHFIVLPDYAPVIWSCYGEKSQKI